MPEERDITKTYKITHKAEWWHRECVVSMSGTRGRQKQPSSGSFEKKKTGVVELPAAGCCGYNRTNPLNEKVLHLAKLLKHELLQDEKVFLRSIPSTTNFYLPLPEARCRS